MIKDFKLCWIYLKNLYDIFQIKVRSYSEKLNVKLFRTTKKGKEYAF